MIPHHNISRRSLLQASASMAASMSTMAGLPAALAQRAEEPMNLAKIILGSPAGTLLDLFARRIADAIQPAYARNIIVENRVGAAGQIAISAVKGLPADGTTILLTPSPMMYLYPHTYRKLPYDPVEDFTPVSLGATLDCALAVGPPWCRRASKPRRSFSRGARRTRPRPISARRLLLRHRTSPAAWPPAPLACR